ncbi:MAG TPA: RNA-directed DNA polymerase [Magnetococcales bacterium]|nr:RNA-directed DNA polymerase [Magnetococcales bacterium]
MRRNIQRPPVLVGAKHRASGWAFIHSCVVMRRFGNLFEDIASPNNLWRAWREFSQGKSRRPTVVAFAWRADQEIFHLHQELMADSYRPQGYHLKMIHEPKRRLVAAAPVRDRVVHHAIYRVLAPRLDPGLIRETWACLPGRGSRRAEIACLGAMRKFPWRLALDIRHYFPSIDHAILMEDVMARRIKDRRLLKLLGEICRSGDGLYRQPGMAEFLGFPPDFPPAGCGLPIGNLTSQWQANHYLSGLDHHCKRILGVPAYHRYMDDMLFFAHSKSQLEKTRAAVAAWLWDHRRLKLKHPNAAVLSTRRPMTWLGKRISTAGINPSRRQLQKMQRRMTALVRQGDEKTIRHSVASYRGMLL